jgi:hypothetical protein
MPENLPFGKYHGASVEQVLLQDYNYFVQVLENTAMPAPLKARFNYVEFVANNFVSQRSCAYRGCMEPARHLVVYHYNSKGRSPLEGAIYCSEGCFQLSGTHSTHELALESLSFRTALSPLHHDIPDFIELFKECMDLKEGRKTKKYLEDFFDNCKTWKKYTPPRNKKLIYSLFP